MKKTEKPEYSTSIINKVSYSFSKVVMSETSDVIVAENQTNQSKLIRTTSTDTVIVEQPLKITLSWIEKTEVKNKVFTITMRTPGHDDLLIVGLLHSEGIIKQLNNIDSIKIESDDVAGEERKNEWLVQFTRGFFPNLSSLDRYMMSYSSCGLCGTTSLKTLQLKTEINLSFTEHRNVLKAQSLLLLSNKMRNEQSLFDKTGGVHGAALFELESREECENKLKSEPNRKSKQQFHRLLQPKLNLQHVYEDIGRHNAVDKIIGALLTSSPSNVLLVPANDDELSLALPLRLLLVSGRISFEIVQKTIMAGIHILVGVGAPSDLAIQAAKQFDLTLIGFVSDKGFNVYHGDWRLNND
ncbi:formate dehydrogenase accessory sulfurtransferase FdhD [Colwellia psychrerythraea]|uniref:Sulfur carrier protein FdhD n=1 Tax=Colwellia psychrerythraea TaxID=28229 RepID=A0A099KT86_COLPS|nr:formate dehydrogenase accessory sulfurtransferase FdhD [Colwellia psychrerythraea]KGJ92888.1 formate dehydrogenase subunit FdhD [Colwellia psychrerythraea]